MKELLTEYGFRSHNPLEHDCYPFNIKVEEGSVVSLSKANADEIWTSVLKEVFPIIYSYKATQKISSLFNPDEHSTLDLLDCVVNIIDYFVYGYVSGLGTTSRGKSLGGDAYPSFNKVDVERIEKSCVDAIEKVYSCMKNPPIEILKLLNNMKSNIKSNIQKIERHIELNRTRRAYAQRSLLILSYYTSKSTGVITRSIAADLNRFGIELKVTPKQFVDQTTQFEKKVCSELSKAKKTDLLDYLLSRDLGKKQNKTYFVSKHEEFDVSKDNSFPEPEPQQLGPEDAKIVEILKRKSKK
ncbi:hypothetical protein A11Q_2413 [Pseudobdellovibrio exovorus JSS]|uniref:Uncharacterized protein n=2 Tax=Pseudobdellovibrio exovorus TaxID=453816 RepID=M4VTU7_9BACT|nr:hypothetical protein A11Q_2413 [Pseudobdellovibrio exovorus JSS]